MRTFDIVFVPGLRPKPEYAVYHAALLRCIECGLSRLGTSENAVADQLPDALQIYYWTHGVYGEYRDIAMDQLGIDALLVRPQANAEERASIDSMSRKLVQTAHRVGDRIPFLGRRFANERQRTMLSEARAYLRDWQGVGTRTRAGLSELLCDIGAEDRSLVIVGHSLGSVIAYDTLWEISRTSKLAVAGLITIGSPLGTRFVRRLLKGAQLKGADRYPRNISQWTNIAAKGELTALYPRLRDRFDEMLKLNLLESFTDHIDVYNHFVGAHGPNVHSEYGYLIQPVFAQALVNAIKSG